MAMEPIPDEFILQTCNGNDNYYLLLFAKLEFRYYLCLQISLSQDQSNRQVLLDIVRDKFGLSESTVDEWSLNLLSFRRCSRNGCAVDDFGLELLASESSRNQRLSTGSFESHRDLIGTQLNMQIHYTNERELLKQLFGCTPTN